MWCAMRINDNNGGFINCEFEPEGDYSNPLAPNGESTPEPPEDILNNEPTPKEYAVSTVIVRKSLRVPRSARKRKGEAAAIEGPNREVKWVGNPYEKFIKEGTEGYLEPRKSLKTWSETAIGKCREW
ncbi:MAG: hypothetical protein Q9164_003811 [Protoblastenia rupestris]